MIQKIIDTTYAKDHVQTSPEAFDKVNLVFKKMGGSWQKLFEGSTSDIKLLRRILKVAIKVKVFHREPKWY